MKITPLGENVQLELDEVTAGALNTSSRDSAQEYAKIIALSPNVIENAKDYPKSCPKVGDYVFVKAWAIDIINHEDKKYYFCNLNSNGVLAIVR